ncbi:hypothetical protein BDV59DRAFT_87066 [Aspergillus ambiguus]|uniref:uncharacterized protein n=1 Tax=Aspergillus ambiguus TaxID=176160 RepID=UPI003CCD173B
MDPVSALGVVSSLITFVTFAQQIFGETKQIYRSALGFTEENRSLLAVTESLKVWSKNLRFQKNEFQKNEFQKNGLRGSEKTGKEEAIAVYELSTECERIADEIIDVLKECTAKDGSKREATLAVFRNLFTRKKKGEYLARLMRGQDQLVVHTEAMERSEIRDRLRQLSKEKDQDQNLALLHDRLSELSASISERPTAEELKTSLLSLLNMTTEAMAEAFILRSIGYENMDRRMDRIKETHASTFEWIFHHGDNTPDPPSVSFTQWLRKGQGIYPARTLDRTTGPRSIIE